AGIACGATCAATYASGSSVTLTAVPAAGSTFSGWSGGSCTGTGTCTVTMSAAQTVTATFALQSFTLTVSKAGVGSGTVTSAPAGLACGTTCAAAYASGTSATLTPPHLPHPALRRPCRLHLLRLERRELHRHRHLHRHDECGHDGDRHLRPPDLHAHRE